MAIQFGNKINVWENPALFLGKWLHKILCWPKPWNIWITNEMGFVHVSRNSVIQMSLGVKANSFTFILNKIKKSLMDGHKMDIWQLFCWLRTSFLLHCITFTIPFVLLFWENIIAVVLNDKLAKPYDSVHTALSHYLSRNNQYLNISNLSSHPFTMCAVRWCYERLQNIQN